MSKDRSEENFFEEGEVVGFHAHELSKRMRNYLQNLTTKEGIDPVAASHGWLIGYLYRNRDHDIYQRELEEKMHLAKSSIATILQTLEQAGYIKRETPAHDARQKKVVLTEEGCRFEQQMRTRILASEVQVRQGIPEEDLKVFFRVMKQMIKNV